MPAVQTPTGTTSDCRLFYEVQSGDECNTVALAYSLTSSDFLTMNTELNANCSNLWVGYDYCVAPVNGTNTNATSVSTSASSTATSSIVSAPT